jgi:hypothetical protein
MWKQEPWTWWILPQLGFPLGFSLWLILVPVSELPMFADSFFHGLVLTITAITFITSNFSGTIIAWTSEIVENYVRIATMEVFFLSEIPVHLWQAHILYMEIWIHVRLDQNRSKKIPIFERAMAILAMNFLSRSLSFGIFAGSENPGSRSDMDHSFKTPGFKQKIVVALSLGLF